MPKEKACRERGGREALHGKAWMLFSLLFPLLAGEGGPRPFLSPPGALAAANILAFILSLTVLWRHRRTLPRILREPGVILFLAFVLWSAFSLAWSVAPDHTASLAAPFLLGGLLFLASRLEGQDGPMAEGMFRGIIASASLLVLYALYQVGSLRLRMAHHTPSPGVPWDLFLQQAEGYRAPSLFKDANTFGSFLSIIFPLILLRLTHSTGGRRRTWLLAALVLNLTGIFLVASRGPALLVIASAAAAALYLRKRKGKERGGRRGWGTGWLPGAVLLLLLLLQCAAWILGSRLLFSRLLDLGEMVGSALPARFHYWSAAGRCFLDHSVLGVGFNALQQVIFPYLDPGTFTRFPHSFPLQVLAETGLPGGLLFLGGMGVLLLSAGKEAARHDRTFFHLLALCVLLVYSLFDITFQCTTVVFLFYLLSGLLIHPREVKSAEGARRGIAAVLCLLGVLLAGTAAVGEGIRLYIVRRSLENVHLSAGREARSSTLARFEALLPLHHFLVHRAFSNWLFSMASEGHVPPRALTEGAAAYARGGRNPCDAWMLGRRCLAAGAVKEGLPWLRKAVKDFPSNLTFWRTYLEARVRAGRPEEALRRIPALLDGYDRIPGMDRYYGVDRFELEWMLADLYTRAGYKTRAMEAYRRILHRWGGVEAITCYDPVRSRLVRFSLGKRIEAARKALSRLAATGRRRKGNRPDRR